MLILEGADLVGKTTLAQTLLKTPWMSSQGYVYRHLSRLSESFDRYGGHCMMAARLTVQDRFHMSDIVYHQVRKEEQRFTPETYRAVDGFLRGFGAYTVLIVCEDNDMLVRRLRDGEMYNPEQILHANHLYGQLVGLNEPYQDWSVDYDYVVWTSQAKPYADDQDVINILAGYCERQRMVTNRVGPFSKYTNMYWRS